jgi:hypothetical protein
MVNRIAFRRVAVGITMLLAAAISVRAGAPPADAVVVDHHAGLFVVEPATGNVWWRLETGEGIVGAVTHGELTYASLAVADGSSTDVYAVPGAAGSAAMLGRVPGRAVVKAVAVDGSALFLLTLPEPDRDGIVGSPTGVLRLAVPERWRPSTEAPLALRDMGFGLLAPDGRRWYKLRLEEAGVQATELELVRLDFRAGGETAPTILPLSLASGYHSLLLAPNGGTLYLVDYIAQTILLVDPDHLTIRHAVGFGRYPTKRPPCAAALSPRGDRLYVLGNSGSANAGDGIFVFETASWRPVAHHLPGRDFYCLTTSSDGTRLYATAALSADVPFSPSDPQLSTIDAETGLVLNNVSLNLGHCCGFLLGAATAAESADTAGP